MTLALTPEEALDQIMAAAEQDPSVVSEVARRLAIPIMGKLFRDAIDSETGTGTSLSVFDKFAIIGGLYPKKDIAPTAQQGTKFSININLPGPNGSQQTITLEANADAPDTPNETDDVCALGHIPTYLSNLSLDDDLS
jgi:hypothetical protein